MRILITGSEGYIGSNLKLLLEEVGFSYGCVDRKIGISLENFDDFFGYDAIVHLAALSGIPDCNNNPEDAAISNISACFKVFSASNNLGIPVVFASSQAAYEPTSGVYGFTKFAAEKEAFRLNQQNAKIKVYRFANVYGGANYLDTKTVVATFMKHKINNTPILIHGSGSQTRDFIHVDDICRAIILGLSKDLPTDSAIDIGTGKETTILELAKMYDHPYELIEDAEFGVEKSVSTPTLANNLLGFKAKSGVEEFVKKEIKSNKLD